MQSTKSEDKKLKSLQLSPSEPDSSGGGSGSGRMPVQELAGDRQAELDKGHCKSSRNVNEKSGED